MEQYLKETAMLNYSAGEIQKLISDRQWRSADEFSRIRRCRKGFSQSCH